MLLDGRAEKQGDFVHGRMFGSRLDKCRIALQVCISLGFVRENTERGSMDDDIRRDVRALAAAYLAKDNPLGWFEELYVRGAKGEAVIPWADMTPNPNLVDWLERQGPPEKGQRAIVVGCGCGDDAEELARRGWHTTAFDISETAIRNCRERLRGSRVDYVAANLLDPPQRWKEGFDLVVEIYTVQALPPDLRSAAIDAVASLIHPGGTAVVIAKARDASEPPGCMPWPLTRGEMKRFRACGLEELSFEDYTDGESPPSRRFRAVYRKPGGH